VVDNVKCRHCEDTGKYKEPKDKKLFDRLVDIEMDKAYMVNYAMAEEKAYKKVGYTIVDCPFCDCDSREQQR
jgi:hypothetical protein